MAVSSFPIFGTGGNWKVASGSGTPSDPFVPVVNIAAGASQSLAKLGFNSQPTDTYAATMTIDVTITSHVIAASHTTSATVTYTPSAAGTEGDILIILTEADSSGSVVATFASTFHSSGTQTTSLSTFSSIVFQSDGTRWIEICRTTALS